jgi:hypothetical protein
LEIKVVLCFYDFSPQLFLRWGLPFMLWWDWTPILPISTSQAARIIGISHNIQAKSLFFESINKNGKYLLD